ncbi:MAG: AAA family ATPase [Clostridia bacterium]|nr:AAA family ATPase [Clostridia bacterium]
MGLKLAITSGKGGTGKSTVSTALSFAFSSLGKSVLLIDADEGLRCLDLMLGMDKDIVFDLSDVLGKDDISNAVYKCNGNERISLIPAPNKSGVIKCEEFAQLLKKASSEYDVVIVDFPAGVDFSLYNALGKDAVFITVCTPDPISVRDAASVYQNLPDTLKHPRIILNKFNPKLIKSGTYDNIDGIINTCGMQLLGIVPQSDELMLLPIYHKLKKHGKPLKAFIRICKRLCGNEVRLVKLKKL